MYTIKLVDANIISSEQNTTTYGFKHSQIVSTTGRVTAVVGKITLPLGPLGKN